MDNQQKIEVLTQARDIIEQKGLSTGTFIKDDGCMCTVGAIIKSLHPDMQPDDSFVFYINEDEVKDLTEVMYSVMKSKPSHEFRKDSGRYHFNIREVIFDVNDVSTQVEVVNYFNKAIKELS